MTFSGAVNVLSIFVYIFMHLHILSLLGSAAGNRASPSRRDKYWQYRLHQGISFRLRFCKGFIKNHFISLQGGSVSSILQYVKLPIVDRDTCSGQMKRRILDGEICAGIPAGGKDACQVQFFVWLQIFHSLVLSPWILADPFRCFHNIANSDY